MLILLTTVPMFVAGFFLTVFGAMLAGGVDDQDLPIQDDFAVLGGLVLAVGILLTAAAVWGVVVAVGVLRRRHWARTAAIVTFSAYATIQVLGVIADRGGATPAGLVSLAVCGVIVALLSLGGACADCVA